MILSQFASAVLVCLAAAADTLPEELQGLSELRDEGVFVAALRDFDRLQVDLSRWDLDMAVQFAKRGEEDLAEARKAQALRRFELVDRAYKEAIRRYPNNGRVRNWYGEFRYDQAGDMDTALMSWKLAMSLDPSMGGPYNNLGIHYCHVGEHSRCLGYLEDAVEREPDNPDFLFNLAQLYFIHMHRVSKRHGWSQKRVYAEAMKLSRRAAELDPSDYDLLQDHAVNFFGAENFGVEADWSKAAEAWQAARPYARTREEEFYTWLNEGRAWLRKPEAQRAESCLRAALAIRPDSAVARRLLEGLAAPSNGSAHGNDNEQ